jgi:glycine/D-amino acid oxidase-like deaminating enzyme
MKEKDTIYFDYLIVGGGVHGLSSAYQLSKEIKKNGEKVKIALVEQF